MYAHVCTFYASYFLLLLFLLISYYHVGGQGGSFYMFCLLLYVKTNEKHFVTFVCEKHKQYIYTLQYYIYNYYISYKTL